MSVFSFGVQILGIAPEQCGITPLNEAFSGAEAAEFGLIWKVADEEDHVAFVEDVFERLARAPTVGVALA